MKDSENFGLENNCNSVEDEELSTSESSILMNDPFDPKKIDITTKQLTIDLLIKRMAAYPEEIDLNTYFQRKQGLWSDKQQSQLIESILIKFPLPAFYFDASNNDKWLVVDGLQRLTALKRFVVTKDLFLTGLEFLTDLEGITYDKLSRPLQRQIDETQIVTYQINAGTPDDVKYNIFKRLNTGGVTLEQQEIRHAVFQGVSSEFVASLANCNEFKTVTQNLVSPERMLDREFVTRFVAFYTKDINVSYQSDMETFLNDGMRDIKNLTVTERDTIKQNFIQSMILAKKLFGAWAFRKADNLERRKPLNKALFEVWSVILAKLSENDRDKLLQYKTILWHKFVNIMQTDPIFMASITSATGDKTRIIYRHNTINSLVKYVLEYDK
ncbi:DUF262 domain-containing protein [Parabacteroides goldsteinii]|uniref:DUF262 domain-containing protein n=1 Tax=Parabacteroides goldsteinii TaxID=328812 RepID=UPI002493BF34|nr:DUF262 domain-containing protein [Parabacteroides goldsteinii]